MAKKLKTDHIPDKYMYALHKVAEAIRHASKTMEDVDIEAFTYDDITHMEPSRPDKEEYWYFTCAMIDRCKPLFDNCRANYGVEDKLRERGVIRDSYETDTESCQLWVYFDTKAAGRQFIDDLNDYLQEKTERIEEARSY